MRKYLVALLAIPVLATVYVSTALQRSALVRVGVALGAGAFLALGVMSLVRPAATTRTRLPPEIRARAASSSPWTVRAPG